MLSKPHFNMAASRLDNSSGESDHLHDVELAAADGFFDNDTVSSFSWKNLNVTVKDHKTGIDVNILSQCSGHMEAGEVIALMGPSGSGKTTLLNVLANRSQSPLNGEIQVNGHPVGASSVRQISSYVEQEDALIGSLTVEETIDFTAKLAGGMKPRERKARVSDLLQSLGLQKQKDTIVGTPLKKGISGGQKRRLSVATQLLTAPKILFLDEPTSGLDSVASFEVMKFISRIARKHKILVIASIHQPSTSTFEIFDSVLLLARGQTCYFGPTTQVTSYFNNLYPVPVHTNPAEYLLELVNTDFIRDEKDAGKVDHIVQAWQSNYSSSFRTNNIQRKPLPPSPSDGSLQQTSSRPKQSFAVAASIPFILLHRNFKKSYRDLLTYGTRILMYTGLAIMMGTVWLRLPYTQSSIQPFINAIFFGGAFMSFMAVAYVPSIIEDLFMLKKEHANGLYGPLAFIIANTLIGLPWLFLITMIFSIISYWLGNFESSGSGFGMWVLYLFLDLVAAESLVVLVSTIAMNFVIALAVTAFANGLWMAVGGFLVPLGTLNVFWKYVFHYIDYQAYVFQGMMVNQFKSTTYDCATMGNDYQCMYASDLAANGQIRGTAVLDTYHISHGSGVHGRWIGIMIGIIAGYRILGYLALIWRSKSV